MKKIILYAVFVLLISSSCLSLGKNSTRSPVEANGVQTQKETILNPVMDTSAATMMPPTKAPTVTPLPPTVIKPFPIESMPIIVSRGTFTLETQAEQGQTKDNSFDLDTGAHTAGTESDIMFSIECGSMCYSTLDPIHGTRSHLIDIPRAGYADCIKNLDQYIEGSIPDWEKTSIICFLTNEDNLSLVTILDSLQQENGESINLTFITWGKGK